MTNPNEPNYQQQNSYNQNPYEPGPSRDNEFLVTLLLLIFLGTLGIHHFYNKNNKRGGIMLACTLLGFITCGLSSIVSVIFWVIDLVDLVKGNYRHADGHIIR